MGEGSFAARYSGAPALARLADQHHPTLHGRDADLAHGHDTKDRRSHAAAGDDVHPADLLIYLLQFCCSSGIVLHCTKPFQYLAILSEQTTTRANTRKSCACRKTKAMMTQKDLLDTMLGYLGFVVEIEETTNEGGNPTLQID